MNGTRLFSVVSNFILRLGWLLMETTWIYFLAAFVSLVRWLSDLQYTVESVLMPPYLLLVGFLGAAQLISRYVRDRYEGEKQERLRTLVIVLGVLVAGGFSLLASIYAEPGFLASVWWHEFLSATKSTVAYLLGFGLWWLGINQGFRASEGEYHDTKAVFKRALIYSVLFLVLIVVLGFYSPNGEIWLSVADTGMRMVVFVFLVVTLVSLTLANEGREEGKKPVLGFLLGLGLFVAVFAKVIDFLFATRGDAIAQATLNGLKSFGEAIFSFLQIVLYPIARGIDLFVVWIRSLRRKPTYTDSDGEFFSQFEFLEGIEGRIKEADMEYLVGFLALVIVLMLVYWLLGNLNILPKKRHEDMDQESESLGFSLGGLSNMVEGIKQKFVQWRKELGNSESHRVRKLYRKVLKEAEKEDVYRYKSTTVREFERTLRKIWPVNDEELRILTGIYEQARYGSKITQEDVIRVEELFKEFPRKGGE